MFGYLVAGKELLDETAAARYRAAYCGLCHSLRARHGLSAGLTLNYDMTFLVLLLGSLYEPEEHCTESRCPAHPVKKQDWLSTEFSDYGADMNVLLAYLKCRDNWDDERSLPHLAEAELLKRAYRRVCRDYPRQSAVIRENMALLSRLETSHEADGDRAAESFGRIMAELFVFRSDRWEPTLRQMGLALGRFLYVMDAAMDLEDDAGWGSYNPFASRLGQENGAYFTALLRMLLGECVLAFDRLPLVQDADILKNILCVGVWAQFDRKYKQEGSLNGSGSV